MLDNTRGIVLRSVRYGETSLISTLFTELHGVQSYMVQGVRSSKAKSQKAGLLQVATLLDMVVYHNPQKKLQRIREFRPAHIYNSVQEEIVKNSIAQFSAELLLKLLPEHAIMQELFEFAFDYFVQLDTMPVNDVANFPLWFIIQCSRILGYPVHGAYSSATPYLNLKEGAFMSQAPANASQLYEDDAKALSMLLQISTYPGIKSVSMNATMRYRLLDWYIEFLQEHTQHLGNIKSLGVLQAILH